MKMVWTPRSSGLDDICGEESVRWTWCSTEFGIDIWSPTIAASCQLLHHFFPGEHANGNRGSPWNGSVKDLVGLRARFNGICVAWRIREMCLSDKTWQPGLLLVIHGSLRKMPIWMYSFEHASTLLSWRYIDVDICESIGLDIDWISWTLYPLFYPRHWGLFQLCKFYFQARHVLHYSASVFLDSMSPCIAKFQLHVGTTS